MGAVISGQGKQTMNCSIGCVAQTQIGLSDADADADDADDAEG